VLAFSERAVARDIELVLRSAVANAEANHGLIGDELTVIAAYANEGPTLKRFRPRARGRIGRIQKKTCHITVKLAELGDGAVRPRRPQAETPAAEEAPKPRRRAAAEPKAEAASATTTEDQPKPKRAPRKKAETKEETTD
jgi:large subunit ribosomal protein L22